MAGVKVATYEGTTDSLYLVGRQGRKVSWYPLGTLTEGGPPVLTVTGTPATSRGYYVAEVYDVAPGVRVCQLWVQVGQGGHRVAMIHDGTDFCPGYALYSSRTGDGTLDDPYVFTVRPDGRWPTGVAIDLYVQVVDQAGNLLSG